ncbi:MAG: cation:proton antiporter [Desulfobacteraceae bacterium]|uniref:Cation:proton antiporter n=1 Tax=Candidatus Desulfaltia bathyphila TaxID=2841697 RepID=A0A8J6N294_9BACT|nr:cation:proton antiporter [Candidatus Desulfaltia bathyphila]
METIHPLVYIGLLLLLSYTGGKAANYFNAPRVTGYLVIGVLLSPSLLGLFHENLVKEELALITDIALSIIAFSIGGSLSLIKLKKLGKHIFWITFTQAFGAFISTTLMLSLFFYFIHSLGAIQSSFWTLYFPMAFVIGAISAATAPAAIMAIVHEYRAKGPFTTMLLGVIALDDALTILFAAFAFSMAYVFVNQEAVSLMSFLFSPVFSICLSLSIGGVLGMCLRKLIGFVLRKEAILGVIAGAIFLAGGLAISLNVSPLLANMMMGFVVVNFVKHREDLFAVVESIEEPIFGMFFTLAGAHMDLKVMQTAGLISLIIVLGRFTGKLLGSSFGAQISRAPEAVKKYLGMALLPKAGVTVGLVLAAGEVFGDTYMSEIMVNAVLGSIIINELIAPFFVRYSLRRAGEA